MAKPPPSSNNDNTNPTRKPSRHSRKPSSSTSNYSRTSNTHSRTSSAAVNKTSIHINIYDLLPPGRLSSLLWTIGSSLLHTGVVINGKEYAYGGHDRKGVTGVYYTSPGVETPGATFRASVLQGFTFMEAEEVDRVVKEISDTFLGPSYNLLQNNCNHFTSALCQALTSKPAPSYLNRAASIGLALPCMVPKEWIAPPPDHETAEGELLLHDDDGDIEEEDEEEEEDENAGLVESDRKRQNRENQRDRMGRGNSTVGGRRIEGELPPARVVNLKKTTTRDEEGRELPAAERAPLPNNSGRKS